LLGGPSQVNSKTSFCDTSITGGVGTRFYCAPEQEGRSFSNRNRGRTDYDTRADIFSLGIVLFEMFHPPFSTMMQRAETLEKLRGKLPCINLNNRDLSMIAFVTEPTVIVASSEKHLSELPKGRDILENDLWKEHAQLRFPPGLDNNILPENAQKLILWCLQFDSRARPSAEEILKSELIPQMENHNELLNTLFNRQTASVSNEIDITWDTDAAAKVREYFPARGKNSLLNTLIHNLREIGGSTWKDSQSLQSSAMNHVSMCAANTTLRRTLTASKFRGASQNVASVLAMAAATTSASTGTADGFLPRLNESICNQFRLLFENHGAVKLSPPLLRPKGRGDVGRDGLVEVMNERGIILTLPEDLTANFARSIGRAGGLGGLKRYDIDRTYHKSKVGGHPIESLEASFDIVLEGGNAQSHIFEAENIMLVGQAMKLFVHRLGRKLYSTSQFLTFCLKD
jgi:serine/threonine protein kinase